MLIAMNTKNQTGFTLVEITIVLIAAGLLIVGILKAGDVIRSGRLNKIVTDFTKYETAAGAFKNKFLYLPGDMPDARNRLNNCAGASCFNGNNDGIIGQVGRTDAVDQTGVGLPAVETSMFWKHLAVSNYISGIDLGSNPTTPLMSSTHPTSSVGGTYDVFHRVAVGNQPASHVIGLKACPNTTVCGANFLDARDVAYLDNKIDGTLDPSRGQIVGGGASCNSTTGAYTYNTTSCFALYITREF